MGRAAQAQTGQPLAQLHGYDRPAELGVHLRPGLGHRTAPAKVRDDLADMLDDGIFPQGFLDYGGDRLVLSGDGLTGAPGSRPPRLRPPRPTKTLSWPRYGR